jgi:hypothetical protein
MCFKDITVFTNNISYECSKIQVVAYSERELISEMNLGREFIIYI